MPAKKKTEEVVEQKTHTIPHVEYHVVPLEEVADYLLKGYTLVGGAVVRLNCWYQAVILNTTKTVSKEEYEEFARKYME